MIGSFLRYLDFCLWFVIIVLNFLSFNSDAKPWPFNDKSESSEANEEAEVVEEESEEFNSGDEQIS